MIKLESIFIILKTVFLMLQDYLFITKSPACAKILSYYFLNYFVITFSDLLEYLQSWTFLFQEWILTQHRVILCTFVFWFCIFMNKETSHSVCTKSFFMEREAELGFVFLIGRDLFLEFMFTVCIIALGSVGAYSKLLPVATHLCLHFCLISAHAAFGVSYIF